MNTAIWIAESLHYHNIFNWLYPQDKIKSSRKKIFFPAEISVFLCFQINAFGKEQFLFCSMTATISFVFAQ